MNITSSAQIEPKVDLAIVGAGLAGTVLAAEVARRGDSSRGVIAFDPAEPGPGNAYATTNPDHLMNGPAREMYAVPGRPDDLVRRRASGDPNELIPRTDFAAYLRELAATTAADHPNVRFEQSEIVQIVPSADGYVLTGAREGRWHARKVVLALGNALPGNTFLPDAVHAHPNYFGDPWRFDASAIDGDVLIIGTGLTAMDAIVSLARSGFRHRIHIVSRHGCFPQLEDPAAGSLDASTLALDTSSPYALLHSMRRAARTFAAEGGDWRRVVDAIRRQSPQIWRAWNTRDRRRFLRHLQAYWSVHRYRVPRQTADVCRAFEASGQLRRYRGAVRDVRVDPEHFTVMIERAGERGRMRVRYIINCTGPESDYLRIPRPLVRDMLRRGLIRPDALRLGIDATESFNVIGAHGDPWPTLFTLGPPLRGLWYEATGVPELRDHAARLAEILVR